MAAHLLVWNMDDAALTTAVWDVDAADFPADGPPDAQARFVLSYAILAPSSHNSQPWRFGIDGGTITVRTDEDRWLAVADDDKRELHVSVGCAIENLVVAAGNFGLAPRVRHGEGADPAAVVTLRPDADPEGSSPDELFAALTERYTSHALFADRPIPAARLDRLREVVPDDVTLTLLTDGETKRRVGELQARADEALMADPAYRKELGHWIGTGALGASWLAARVGQTVVTHFDLGGREARKNSKLVASAPVVGLLSTDADDPRAQVRTGRAFERLALAAAAEDLAVHPMSQTLERPDTREELAELAGVDGRPQHLFRLGYADEAPEHTPRWPVEAVLA
jgi:nitroreductase